MLPLPQNARSSLIIVDMQDFFFRDAARRRNLEQVVKNINLLIEYFDAHSWPVFHVLSGFKADGSDWDLKMRAAGKPELIVGSDEAKVVPGIKISEYHQTIIKTRYSAFFKTNLAELLQAQKIDRVVVVGAYTHYCVNATIFDAYCYDFVPCIIIDAVISHLPDEAGIMIARMQRNGYHLFSTQALIAA
jgi:nicotinamidase-related amidase